MSRREINAVIQIHTRDVIVACVVCAIAGTTFAGSVRPSLYEFNAAMQRDISDLGVQVRTPPVFDNNISFGETANFRPVYWTDYDWASGVGTEFPDQSAMVNVTVVPIPPALPLGLIALSGVVVGTMFSRRRRANQFHF